MFNQKLQIISKSNSVSFRYLNRVLVVILRSDIHVSESLHVCSADSLNVMRPRTRLKFGACGVSAAAPDAWNSLPTHVKSAPSLDAFTDRLKTELFRLHETYA